MWDITPSTDLLPHLNHHPWLHSNRGLKWEEQSEQLCMTKNTSLHLFCQQFSLRSLPLHSWSLCQEHCLQLHVSGPLGYFPLCYFEEVPMNPAVSSIYLLYKIHLNFENILDPWAFTSSLKKKWTLHSVFTFKVHECFTLVSTFFFSCCKPNSPWCWMGAQRN